MRRLILYGLAMMVVAGHALIADDKSPAPASYSPPELDPRNQDMPYFELVKDPLEPFNRTMHGFNRFAFNWVVDPASQVYTFVLPEAVRDSIGKAGHNLAYPVRLVNTTLQGKWGAAWDETRRFGINSTVGLAGFFDPATSQFHIPASNEDFGQTLGSWGMGPGFYLELPLLGPSSGRDALGRVADYPLNLANYLTTTGDPSVGIEFKGPYQANTPIPNIITFNSIAGRTDLVGRILEAEYDSYYFAQLMWAVQREQQVIDFKPVPGDREEIEPSIGALQFQPKDESFWRKSKSLKVRTSAGQTVPCELWLQKERGPLVVILPGLGGHRLGNSTVALAELYFQAGCSVVGMTNSMNPEWLQTGATVPFTGYGPQDAQDISTVLLGIAKELDERYPERFSTRALVGMSLGGFQTLYLTADEDIDAIFDHFVAINPPHTLKTALEKLDSYYYIVHNWPKENRRERALNSFYKVAYLAQSGFEADQPLPLTLTESQFLIGMSFRLLLSNLIYESQRHSDWQFLECDSSSFSRDDCYRECRRWSYDDYMENLVIPYFTQKTAVTRERLLEASSLDAVLPTLVRNPEVYVYITDNDFLLTDRHHSWFTSVIGDHLVRFPDGGHLGHLADPRVQERLLDWLKPEE